MSHFHDLIRPPIDAHTDDASRLNSHKAAVRVPFPEHSLNQSPVSWRTCWFPLFFFFLKFSHQTPHFMCKFILVCDLHRLLFAKWSREIGNNESLETDSKRIVPTTTSRRGGAVLAVRFWFLAAQLDCAKPWIRFYGSLHFNLCLFTSKPRVK